MNKIKFYGPLLILSTFLFASQVNAHKGATGVVKERMDAMNAMGDEMEIMGDMVKGKRALKAAAFADGAAIISEESARIPDLFPQGSLDSTSDALPRLWQEWEQFQAKAKRTRIEAEKLAALADGKGDDRALKVQFIKLGKSCKSCHTDYRKKKKKH